MHKITLFILVAMFAVALAGQYYVPRAYYTIDAEGHESARVPLRRLRRSVRPHPTPSTGKQTAKPYDYGNGGYGPSGLIIKPVARTPSWHKHTAKLD